MSAEEAAATAKKYYGEVASPEDVLEQFDEHFRTDSEFDDYERLMKVVEDAYEVKVAATEVQARAETQNDAAGMAKAKEMFQDCDAAVSKAMRDLMAAIDDVNPIHEPTELDVERLSAGRTGRVPVGKGSMGLVAEDAMRYIADRREMKFADPKMLAKRLLDGQLVKFTNVYEKMIVTRIAQSMDASSGKKRSEQVDFSPLAPAAQGDMVKSIIGGRYEDPSDAKLEGDVAKNIARILGNNATYPRSAKHTVQQTIQALLPANKPQTSQKRAKVGS